MTSPKGDDQTYLREVQYKDGSNLAARADLHAKYRTAPVPWFPWLVAQVDWPAHGDVLEVGCGMGWLWADVDAPLRVTVTDLSEGMVAEASERVRAADNLTLAEATVADAQALPFDAASFDVVVANHMLYHVPDVSLAVRELRRVLRPGGVLVAATNGNDHMRELGAVRAAVFGGDSLLEFAARFGKANGAEILGQCFGSVEWRPYPDALRCTDADDVVAYIASMSPSQVAPEHRAALRAEVEARMVDGAFRVTKESGVFLAR